MAHFAQLDENNLVTQVIVVHNNELLDSEGNEVEEVGIVFCKALFGSSTVWKQTSYNGNMRKNFAGVDYSYDAGRDAFIPPQPYASWVLDETTCLWEAPVARPDLTQDQIDAGSYYTWNEDTTSWDLVTP
tara:strand:+ start:344 stop:733 length:390 start_codon:yes stop_codon:yes gene_type:complete